MTFNQHFLSLPSFLFPFSFLWQQCFRPSVLWSVRHWRQPGIYPPDRTLALHIAWQRGDLTFWITVRQEKRHIEIQKTTCDFKRARLETVYTSDWISTISNSTSNYLFTSPRKCPKKGKDRKNGTRYSFCCYCAPAGKLAHHAIYPNQILSGNRLSAYNKQSWRSLSNTELQTLKLR